MGILNLTPDSFYLPAGQTPFTGGPKQRLEAVRTAGKLIESGADFIDVGGMSSRPGAQLIEAGEELQRIIPVIREIRIAFPHVPISVDTVHSAVAARAIDAGASMVNDISAGLIDNNLLDVVAKAGVPYVLMHMRGTPEKMQKMPFYEDVFLEVYDFFSKHLHRLAGLGIQDVILDPGFGFGKTVEHNFCLLSRLSEFRSLGKPIMAGLSRKSMICKTLGINPSNALNGTSSLNTIALMQGAGILRVHDPAEASQCLMLVNKISEQTKQRCI